ncbi:MAG: serine/threonine-protein kinase [Myxococcota bacterium]
MSADGEDAGSTATAPSASPSASTLGGAHAVDEHANRLLGAELIERYVVDEIIGQGGMATVYVGRHLKILKPVAIKVLSPSDSLRTVTARRFLKEAQLASTLRHEHIVDINDFGETDDGCPFFVMEYLEGEDLAALIAREAPLPLPRVIALLEQVLDALSAAHEAGIVHRDMKPQNCFRLSRHGSDDFVKVLDFGIAKMASAEGATATGTGVLLGTPAYMAPEQAEQGDVDARTDLYAIGTMLFEMVTGQRPFGKAPAIALLTRKLHEEAPRARSLSPDVPRWVDALIASLLERNPDDRPATAEAVAAALRAGDPGPGPELPADSPATERAAERPWLVPAVVAGVASVGLLGWWAVADRDGGAADSHVAAAAASDVAKPSGALATAPPEQPPSIATPAESTASEAAGTGGPAGAEDLPPGTGLADEPVAALDAVDSDSGGDGSSGGDTTGDTDGAALDPGPTASDIRRAIVRKAGPDVRRCAALATHERQVRVSVTIAPTGRVRAKAHPTGDLGPSFLQCVEQAVQKISFDPGPRRRRLDVKIPLR